MKLACSISIGNRLLPELAINSRRKYSKSTLALCRKPKTQEFCLILFTNQDKTGTKYNIKRNISKVLTRFINDGKATIQLKSPPLDLYIIAEIIQLKSFLQLLKRALENKIPANELTCTSMSVTPFSAQDFEPKKLIIKSRADYPTEKDFPKSLEILHINDIKRLQKGLLHLTNLKVLNLSNSSIDYLPEELNNLSCLRELDLSNNNLSKSSLKQWGWMGGSLSRSLVCLNLESNNLAYLPDQIIKFYKLEILNVNNNELYRLPFGIGNLRHLRVLKIAKNLLTMLPGSLKKSRLQHIDLTNNQLSYMHRPPLYPSFGPPTTLPICTLKETAAKRVLNSRIYYASDIIPRNLVNYLDYAKYCVCGKACFETFIREARPILIPNLATEVIQNKGLTSVPLDCYFCSLICYRSISYRVRVPVSR